MATQPKTSGLTYEDLRAFPDDNLRREIIDGELFVTASPIRRHQRVSMRLGAALFAHEMQYGGEVYPAPTDVFFSDSNVVEPDLLFLRPENLEVHDPDKVAPVPDLVVEISSPSTRRRYPGGMFWCSRNTLSGSYVRFNALSRSYFASP